MGHLLVLCFVLGASIANGSNALDRLIIVTKTYLWQHEHYEIVDNTTCSSLTFVWRNSLASAYPTDFSVVKVEHDAVNSALDCLYKSPLIKTIFGDAASVVKPLVVDESDVSEVDMSPTSNSSDVPSSNCSNFDINPKESNADVSHTFTNFKYNARGFNIGPETMKTLLAEQDSGNVDAFIPSSITRNVGPQFRGQHVKVAVFDTGLDDNHPYFKKVRARTDWTSDGKQHDDVGHGSFVSR